jgi:peptide deformylase
MTVYKILKYPHVLLKKKSTPVEKTTPGLRKFTDNMISTMRAFDGIGLAAPQVGILKRIMVVDISAYFENEELKDWHGSPTQTINGETSPLVFPLILVNPEIVRTEGTVEFPYDGCLSFPGVTRGTSNRHRFIELHATDSEGRSLKIQADGIMSICLQHEMDHLEGVLFVDRIDDDRTEEDILGEIEEFEHDPKERKRIKKLSLVDARNEKHDFV